MVAAAVSNVRAVGAYDRTILCDHPVMFLAMDTPGSGLPEADLSGHGNNGTYLGGTPHSAILPNGYKAADFNGSSQFPDRARPPPRCPSRPGGAITIESWITALHPWSSRIRRPEGYVYWLGKGNPTNGYEYANRMYSLANSAGRQNRISDYQWNPGAAWAREATSRTR